MTTSFALLGSTTLGSANITISVTGLPTKKYLIIEFYNPSSDAVKNATLRFNNDSGFNYSYRDPLNGGSEDISASQTSISIGGDNSSNPQYVRLFVINIASQEKLVIGHSVMQNTAGAGNAPARRETAGKWANTSSQINEIDIGVSGANWGIGTILTVYGSD